MTIGKQHSIAESAQFSLTDNEVESLARFAVLERGRVSDADYCMGLIVDHVAKVRDLRFAYVAWPTGVRAIVPVAPGDRSTAARIALLKVYRAAERGYLGSLDLESDHG